MVYVRWRIVVLVVVVALLSGAMGFYIGLGKGAEIMGTIASQNRVYEALSDVRRSMSALQSNDAALAKNKVALDLRIALFSLDAYGSAVPYIKCSDKDRKALESARSYAAANADPKIFNGAPELEHGLNFCSGRSS
jgi:hypothetical protein